jgi:hypothetical protein
MEESFVIGLSRPSFRWLLFVLNLFWLLSFPAVLSGQDMSRLRQRAEKGDAAAQVDLGVASKNGKDVPKAESIYFRQKEQLWAG